MTFVLFGQALLEQAAEVLEIECLETRKVFRRVLREDGALEPREELVIEIEMLIHALEEDGERPVVEIEVAFALDEESPREGVERGQVRPGVAFAQSPHEAEPLGQADLEAVTAEEVEEVGEHCWPLQA